MTVAVAASCCSAVMLSRRGVCERACSPVCGRLTGEAPLMSVRGRGALARLAMARGTVWAVERDA